jgi:hypothetical protein
MPDVSIMNLATGIDFTVSTRIAVGQSERVSVLGCSFDYIDVGPTAIAMSMVSTLKLRVQNTLTDGPHLRVQPKRAEGCPALFKLAAGSSKTMMPSVDRICTYDLSLHPAVEPYMCSGAGLRARIH